MKEKIKYRVEYYLYREIAPGVKFDADSPEKWITYFHYDSLDVASKQASKLQESISKNVRIIEISEKLVKNFGNL